MMEFRQQASQLANDIHEIESHFDTIAESFIHESYSQEIMSTLPRVLEELTTFIEEHKFLLHQAASSKEKLIIPKKSETIMRQTDEDAPANQKSILLFNECQ